MADRSNEHDPTILAHTDEVVGCGARDASVFFYFLVAGMVPPMLLFLHTVLSTYGVVLAHLHPNALLALAIFQHFCEAYVGVRPSVALFRVFFDACLDAGGALHPHASYGLGGMAGELVLREVLGGGGTCDVRRADGTPEALPIRTSPASMAGPEAAVERIQHLRDLHLAAHHMVNYFLHHNFAPLQQRSCPHWDMLSRNHPMRLHQESPSKSVILTISNFLTGGNQIELLRPQNVCMLI
jgi:hypothetical protein